MKLTDTDPARLLQASNFQLNFYMKIKLRLPDPRLIIHLRRNLGACYYYRYPWQLGGLITRR